MYRSKDVWMVLKSAKLTTGKDDKGVEHKLAEVQLVIDELPRELALEMGEEVSVHLFSDDGAIRTNLETVTLDPRIPNQRMTVRGGIDMVHTAIENVEIVALTARRQVNEDTGKEWISLTTKARFDFAPKGHREWLAMHFGYGQHFTFEAEQGDLLGQAVIDAAIDSVKAGGEAFDILMGRGDGITSVEMTTSDGKGRRKGVKITKDKVEDVDRPEAR